MPSYVYMGTATMISIAGRRLVRGIPIDADGPVAERLAAHPDIDALDADSATPSASGQPSALEVRRALVARAKELGIPAKGKSDELAAAIAAAEAALASS